VSPHVTMKGNIKTLNTSPAY